MYYNIIYNSILIKKSPEILQNTVFIYVLIDINDIIALLLRLHQLKHSYSNSGAGHMHHSSLFTIISLLHVLKTFISAENGTHIMELLKHARFLPKLP
jgi:hypothetical protein